MSKINNKLLYPAIALVALGLVMALFGGVFHKKVPPQPLDKIKVEDTAQTFTISAQEVVINETLPGTLRARVATVISSRILAGIKTIKVRAGDQVEQGDLLVELDNKDLVSRLDMWRQQVRSFEVKLAQTKPHFERIEKLYNDGVSSKAELDRATAEYQNVLAQLAGAQASQSEAENALSFSQVKAPISGRVIDRLAEPGAMASPGMPLVSVYNPNTLRVEANVRESLALTLKLGDKLEAEIPSLDKKFYSTIEEIVPEAHTGSRSFLIKSSINANPKLVPGLFARISIPLGTEKQIYIPQDFIREMGQLNIVWLLVDGTAHKQVVALGQADNNGNRQLIKGLKEGDIILHPNTFSH